MWFWSALYETAILDCSATYSVFYNFAWTWVPSGSQTFTTICFADSWSRCGQNVNFGILLFFISLFESRDLLLSFLLLSDFSFIILDACLSVLLSLPNLIFSSLSPWQSLSLWTTCLGNKVFYWGLASSRLVPFLVWCSLSHPNQLFLFLSLGQSFYVPLHLSHCHFLSDDTLYSVGGTLRFRTRPRDQVQNGVIPRYKRWANSLWQK